MFWKKRLESKEYKDLKLQIELLWLDIDILTQRYKRKVKSKETLEETGQHGAIDDGLDEVRKINNS